MATKRLVVDGLWQLNLGAVNAFLIDDDELTLIDTGVPGNADKIVAAIESIGKKLRYILITHCHPDHSGSAAALKRMTGAQVSMHPIDAVMVRNGDAKRPMTAAPGLLRPLLYNLFVARAPSKIEPCTIDQEISDGAELPIAGGLRAFHVPGHCAGQLAFWWPRRSVMFVADAASNMPNFGLSLGYENLPEGLRSLAKIASVNFDIACFGHGNIITGGASARFKKKWLVA